ncbi:MAG: hypothetical protein SPL12_08470 [Bacteroidales bacterium]|nr:hypothetical protein [Bacteroidales bacterium]
MLDFVKEIRRKQIIRDLKRVQRDKRIENIDEVKTIGLICRLDNEPNWNVLYHFAKVMENQGKKVYIIALQEQEINFVVTHRDTYICRTKNDINFWGLPSADSLKPFTSNHYDLLIDTIGEENFFSQYIALRTDASLKVVYATPSEDPTEVFDLIIRGDGRVELKGFFNNIVEYLSMIKK